jgi:hypothetical protein
MKRRWALSDHDIHRLINARCNLFPNCSCYHTLLHWQQALEEHDDWSAADLSWAETSIFLALSCVEAHCPSQQYREFAQVQLLNPWWDCQRRGRNRVEELTEGEPPI